MPQKSIRKLRIGGDFELSDQILLGKEFDHHNFFFTKNKYTTFTDTGRSAIFLALTQIKKKTNLNAWVPFYSCSTIVEPFHQLGFKVNYYGMGKDLNTPTGLPDDINDAVILFIHYLGKENVSIISYLNSQKNKGNKFFVIEDKVQTCLSTNYGKYGDFTIDSLRKFLPVPDGAVVKSNEPIEASFTPPSESFISSKILSKLIRGSGGLDNVYLGLYEEGEKIINHKIIPREISKISKFILSRIDIEEFQKRRIQNWIKILNEFNSGLNKSGLFTPLFKILSKNEVPLGFTIIVKDGQRNNFKKHLQNNQIYCPIFWSLTDIEYSDIFQPDLNLSESILTIPVDHRLTNNLIDYLAKVIKKF